MHQAEPQNKKAKKFQSVVDFGWSSAAGASSPPSTQSSSSSSPAAGLPPLRWDAPHRRDRGRGRLAVLSNPHERDVAIDELVADFHSSSSKKTLQGKWSTIEKALSAWGLACFPPSRDTVLALAASLKSGGYVTADSYLYQYRLACERKGHAFSSQLDALLKDCIRSCQRGVGAPTKALALPFRRFQELDLRDDGPWVRDGPVGPACALVVGSWFLTREIELSTTRAAHLTFDKNEDNEPIVRWTLPASKTDQQALGKAVVHGCACGPHSRCGCPFHAGQAQLERLRRLFPEKFEQGVPSMDLALFPTIKGHTVEKEAMVATIVKGAEKLGIPLVSADGSARVSGHSLRVTGAQGLARIGVDTWAIQLLGRWGSATVLEYIKEVPLELSASWARRAAKHVALDEAVVMQSPPLSVGSSAVGSQVSGRAALSLRQALEDERAKVAEEKDSPVVKFLRSSAGIWHKVLPSGRVGPMSSWTTRCGWAFSRSDACLADDLPSSALKFSKCLRCAL